jgi:ubiquitin-like domain-containing CTD phosphatase 1
MLRTIPAQEPRHVLSADALEEPMVVEVEREEGQDADDVLDAEDAQPVELVVKWQGQEHKLRLPMEHCSVLLIKQALQARTLVPVERQKLIGLLPGKNPDDSLMLKDVAGGFKSSFMMMGTPDANLLQVPQPEFIMKIVNDLGPIPQDYPERRLIDEYSQREISLIHQPRPGKKLLVLDLDYTVIDMKNPSPFISDITRPYLHEFMLAVYPHYDVAVWSQTSWRWLEAKITEMGLLTSPEYNISFVLDKTFMFKVDAKDRGHGHAHEVKALEIIWRKFPQYYSAKNTVHVDDLSRNFVLNPQNGIKIRAWKNTTRETKDRELLLLRDYLVLLAGMDDLSTVEHHKWRNKVKGNAE